MRREPDGAGLQLAAAKALGPGLCVSLYAEVEWRLLETGLGDAAGDLLAISGAPALPEPIRDVEPHTVLRGQHLRAALGNPPQDGIGELGETMRGPVAPRRLDGEIDHSVGGHAEAEELGGTGEQDRPQIALVRRQRLFQEGVEHMLELALPAQDGGRNGAGERAVPRLHRRHLGP